ncbi:hypothetical protein CBL_11025 [Carabus blaptoides fortunei]
MSKATPILVNYSPSTLPLALFRLIYLHTELTPPLKPAPTVTYRNPSTCDLHRISHARHISLIELKLDAVEEAAEENNTSSECSGRSVVKFLAESVPAEEIWQRQAIFILCLVRYYCPLLLALLWGDHYFYKNPWSAAMEC